MENENDRRRDARFDVLFRQYHKDVANGDARSLPEYMRDKTRTRAGVPKDKQTSAATMPWRAYQEALPWYQDENVLMGLVEESPETRMAELQNNPDYFMKQLVGATIGRRIEHAVASFGGTDGDAANVLEVTEPTVYGIYAGRGDMVEELTRFMRLCEAYDAHPATVLGVMTPDTAELVDLYESCDAATRAQILAAAKAIAGAIGQPRKLPCETCEPWGDYTTEQVTELCERLKVDPAEL